MRERPILFQPAMVRAILDGEKTQTRRIVKNYPAGLAGFPHGRVGDVLWVRETFAKPYADPGGYIFRADGPEHQQPGDDGYHGWGDNGQWSPSIHMPKQACRLKLRVLSVHVEKLQDMSNDDAKAEGIRVNAPRVNKKTRLNQNREYRQFQNLWESINGHNSWDENPWVWVIKFQVVDED